MADFSQYKEYADATPEKQKAFSDYANSLDESKQSELFSKLTLDTEQPWRQAKFSQEYYGASPEKQVEFEKTFKGLSPEKQKDLNSRLTPLAEPATGSVSGKELVQQAMGPSTKPAGFIPGRSGRALVQRAMGPELSEVEMMNQAAGAVPYFAAPTVAVGLAAKGAELIGKAGYKSPWAVAILTSAITEGYHKIAQTVGIEGGDPSKFNVTDALNVALPLASTTAEKALIRAFNKNPVIKAENKVAQEAALTEAKASARTHLESSVKAMQTPVSIENPAAGFSVQKPIVEVNPAAGFTTGKPTGVGTTPVVETPAIIPEAQLRKTWSEGFADLPNEIGQTVNKAIKGHRKLPEREAIEKSLTRLFPKDPDKVATTLSQYDDAYGLYHAEKTAMVEKATASKNASILADRVDAATLNLDSTLKDFPQAIKDTVRMEGKTPSINSIRQSLVYEGLPKQEAAIKAAAYSKAVGELKDAQKAAGQKVNVAKPIENVQIATEPMAPVEPRIDTRTLPQSEQAPIVDKLSIENRGKAFQALNDAVKGDTKDIRKALKDNASGLSTEESAALSSKLDIIEKPPTPEAAEIAKTDMQNAIDKMTNGFIGGTGNLAWQSIKALGGKFLTSKIGRAIVKEHALTHPTVQGTALAVPNITNQDSPNPGFGESLKRGILSLQDRGNPPIMPGALLK